MHGNPAQNRLTSISIEKFQGCNHDTLPERGLLSCFSTETVTLSVAQTLRSCKKAKRPLTVEVGLEESSFLAVDF